MMWIQNGAAGDVMMWDAGTEGGKGVGAGCRFEALVHLQSVTCSWSAYTITSQLFSALKHEVQTYLES